MLGQVGLLRERLVAVLALKRAFPRVAALVGHQHPLVLGYVAAEAAGEAPRPVRWSIRGHS